MKVLSICNLHDGPHLGPLTKHHPLGIVTFLGRYGLMDFTLSNFSNSGLDKVAILAEQNTREIHSHLRNGNVWINNTRTGWQTILHNSTSVSASLKFNTDINNVLANIDFFEENNDIEYVVVAPPFFLTPLDFRDVLSSHVKSGKEVTLVYKHTNEANEKFINCDSVKVDKENSLIQSFGINSGTKKNNDISLETFVFNYETFMKIVRMTKEVSSLFTLRKMVDYCLQEKIIEINAFETKEVVLPILSLNTYVDESMKLLDYENRLKLFKDDWPIYTTTHNTPPTLYGAKADVKHSFIANGSIINGKVENCIISRGVKIGKGSVVKNSILFYRTEVGDGVTLDNVVTDKRVKVKEIKNIEGKKDEVFFIELGAKV